MVQKWHLLHIQVISTDRKGKVMFLRVCVCSRGGVWCHFLSVPMFFLGVYHVTSCLVPCSFRWGSPYRRRGLSPEGWPPHYWHLVTVTAAVGTHPTGKLSCLAARLSYCLYNRSISNLCVLMAALFDLLAVLFQVWLMAESASTWGGSES